MQIHDLKRRTPQKKSKRVGRGGKRGKTAGRGTKGQKSRAGRKIRPQLRDIIKKLPKKRGYRFSSVRIKPEVVNVGVIEKSFNTGETINPKSLLLRKLVRRSRGRAPGVKILGTGNLSKSFIFENVKVSESAKKKIEKAGGTIKKHE